MKAFSLVEVLLSSLILSLMAVAIFMVLNIGDMAYNTDIAFLDLQQQARQAMDRMVRELRQATSKNIASGGGNITFDTLTAAGIQYYRNASQNRVIREYPAGTQRILGNYVNSLSFCCWHDATSTCDTDCSGSNLIEIQLNATNTIKGKVLSYPLKEQVRLRNE